MEDFKTLEALFEPDERWKYFVGLSHDTGKVTPAALIERYRNVASIELNSTVPEDIRSQFNVAKMLCVYAWLYYSLNQIAELKAFSTLEMGLRERFPQGGKMLRNLLTHAIEAGLINDYGFSHIEADANDPLRYSKQLPNVIPKLRNSLAHGSTDLHPQSIFTLRNCAEIINQVFLVPDRQP